MWLTGSWSPTRGLLSFANLHRPNLRSPELDTGVSQVDLRAAMTSGQIGIYRPGCFLPCVREMKWSFPLYIYINSISRANQLKQRSTVMFEATKKTKGHPTSNIDNQIDFEMAMTMAASQITTGWPVAFRIVITTGVNRERMSSFDIFWVKRPWQIPTGVNRERMSSFDIFWVKRPWQIPTVHGQLVARCPQNLLRCHGIIQHVEAQTSHLTS